MKKMIAALAVSVAISTAAYAETIGSVDLTGWFFKDKANINVFDDPDYPTVSCYVTSVDRALNWDNASDSSIACRLIGDAPDENLSNKSDVFGARTGIFKFQKVDRFYDEKRNVLVYISYVRKLEGTNFSHSISVVPLGKPLSQ